MRRIRGAGRTTAVVVALIALVAMTTACQNWSKYLGGPANTGEATGETTIGPANVSTLTPAFSIPLQGSLLGTGTTVSGGQIFAATDRTLIVADAFGGHGCVGTPSVCQPLWTADLPGGTLGTASQPVVAGTTVYVTSSRDNGGTLFAFDVHGGSNCTGGVPKVCAPLWTAPASSTSGPNVADGVLYVSDYTTHQLMAFDAAGTLNCTGAPRTCQPLWTAPVDSESLPAVAGGRVYVTTRTGTPAIVAFDAAGTSNCTDSPRVCSPLFTVALPASSYSSVAISGAVAYAQTTTGSVVAGDATGASCTGAPAVCAPLWTTPATGSTVTYGATPAIAGGRVYASLTTGVGAILFQFDAAGVENCSPITHICQSSWNSGPAGATAYGQNSPVVTNGLVFLGGKAWDPTANPGCASLVGCPVAWSAPQPSGLTTTTIAYGTAYTRSNVTADGIVAYHLS